MHAVTALAAVVFTCQDIDKSVRFYKSLGFEVRETKHGGVAHFTCSLGGCHFALYPHDGVERGAQSGVQIGVMVTNLNGAIASVAATGANVLQKPTPKPWGITALVEDPDGRKVELVNTTTEQTGPMPF
jgi:lactoylglutathione lyase